MIKRKSCHLLILFISLFLIPLHSSSDHSQKGEADSKLRFAVSFSQEQHPSPLDGRMLLMISTDERREPRFQISAGPNTQLIFGIDVEGLKPGEEALIDDTVFGFPLKSIREIPAGEYWIQALLHRYETFHRSDGHTVKLPMDRGEGQRWNWLPETCTALPKR